MNNNQQHKSTPDHWAEVEACAQQVSSTNDCLLELRSRVEALEGKYETQRLATLEWGKDVETLKLRSDRHLQRIEALESAENYRQQDEDAERAYESSQSGSLVERVRNAIACKHDPKDYCWDEARAAIREVAAALIEWDDSDQPIRTVSDAVNWLEEEAGDA